ncbi:Uncharacterised protein [uncultured archaeon]|nr:Uncharacterised protein [uncultured archaeon]
MYLIFFQYLCFALYLLDKKENLLKYTVNLLINFC